MLFSLHLIESVHKKYSENEMLNYAGDQIMFIQAYVFKSSTGACAAFLSNYHTSSSARVSYNGRSYDLPAWSISILPDCKTAVFNTATVRQIKNNHRN